MTQTQTSFEELLREGGAALRGGERERARALLAQAVRLNSRSEHAWLLLAGAVTDAEQRRTCLERVLRLNPEHSVARRAIATMQNAAPRPQPAPQAAAPQAPAAGSLLGRLQQPEPASAEQPGPAPQPAAPRPTAPQPLSFEQLVAVPSTPAAPQPAAPAAPQPLSFEQLVTVPAPVASPQPAAPAPAVEAPAPLRTAQVVANRPAAISNLIELSAAGVRRKQRERQLWMAALALGVLMMLAGLGLLGLGLLA